MNEYDKKYYETKEQQKKNRERSLSKARNRGGIAEEWLKNNRLTPATKPEFDALMRQADRDFENGVHRST